MIDYRPAGLQDAPGVAALHADSWRRHYRGSYPDDYLDGDVEADRLAEWTARLSSPAPEDRTTVAVDGDGQIIGLVHTILHEDPEWGALLTDGRNYIKTAPWLINVPGVAIFLTVVGFNLLGNTLRDVLDPRLRGR